MVETVILNKNSIFNTLIVFVGLFTSELVYCAEKNINDKQWILWKDSPELHIYYQEIPNTKFIEIKANILVKSSLSAFILFIQDTEHVASWLDKAHKSRVIEQFNESENLFITYFSGAWPIEPRHAVLRTKITQNDDLSIDIFSKDASGDVSQIEDSIRVEVLKAHWHISPINNTQRIAIEYNLAVDPKGDIPAGLLKESMLDSMFKTMSNIQQLLPFSPWQEYKVLHLNEAT